jgi:sec-independent protein translocase protein TatC
MENLIAEDDGMLRMSFLEHLEELRSRIIKVLCGFGAIFSVCLIFSPQLFDIVLSPGLTALRNTHIAGAEFIAIDVIEQFSIVWVWTPLVASIFFSAPWILWQLWAFISPGLYQRERKWAVPFVTCTAGLFILGGVFGYFVALPSGLAFLFGASGASHVVPKITIENYFDRFVDAMLGIGIVFEIPVLVFFLTLIGVASPAFLLKHSRYAILIIVTIAAIVTPTTDAFNLTLFSVPMCLLFYLGLFAGYLLVLKRESRRFPWGAFLKWLAILTFVVLCVLAAVTEYRLHAR